MVRMRTKKIICTALVCGMCSGIMPINAYAANNEGVINGSNVNIRAEASTETKSLGKLQKGDVVEILESKNDWYKIKTKSGVTGYVAGWLINVNQSSTATISEDVVNIRSGAGTHFDRIAQCKKGDKVTIIATEGDWYQVKLGDGKIGYVANWLVTVNQTGSVNTATTPTPTPTPTPETPVVTPTPPVVAPAPPVVTPKPVSYQVVVTGDNVNLRKGPGINYDALASVDSGREFTVTGEVDDWQRVTYNGQEAWIANWLTSKKIPTTPLEKKEVILPLQDNKELMLTQAEPGIVYLGFKNIAEKDYKITTNGQTVQVKIESGNFVPKIHAIDNWGISTIDVSGQLVTIRFNGAIEVADKYQKDTNALSLTVKVAGSISQPSGKPPEKLPEKLPENNSAASYSGNVVMVKSMTPTEKTTALTLNIGAQSNYTVKESSATKLVVMISDASIGGGDTKFVAQQSAIGPISAVMAENVGNQVALTISLTNGSYCHLYRLDNTLYINGTAKNTANSQGLNGKTIVLDPGHGAIQSGGWTDPGAIGAVLGISDRDVGMAIAVKLKGLLEAQGAKVVMTHTGRTTLNLAGRAQVANDLKADAFISIHGNSNTKSSINGIEVYYYAPDSLPNIAAQRYVRNDLANKVKDGMVAASGRSGRALTSNLGVLRENIVPSILVEAGYLSNKEEEALLAQPAYLDKLATGICNGLVNYFNQ